MPFLSSLEVLNRFLRDTHMCTRTHTSVSETNSFTRVFMFWFTSLDHPGPGRLLMLHSNGEQHWLHQRCCASHTNLLPLPRSLELVLRLEGQDQSQWFIAVVNLLMLKIMPSLSLERDFMGQAVNPHKNRGLKWKMLFRLIMSRAIGHGCSKLYFNIRPNEAIRRTRVLQTQPRVLVTKQRKPTVARRCDCHQHPGGNFLIRPLHREPAQASDKGQRIVIISVEGRKGEEKQNKYLSNGGAEVMFIRKTSFRAILNKNKLTMNSIAECT